MGTWGKIGSIGAMVGGGALMFVPGAQLAGLGLIGAGAGMAKHEWDDLPKEKSQMELAAQTEKYAPWTGLHGKMPERSSGIGSALQGGTTGLMLGQGLSSAGLLSSAAPTVTGTSTAAGGANLGVDTNLGYGGASQVASAQATPNLGFNGDLGYGNGIPVLPQNSNMLGNYAGMGGLSGGGSDYWSQLANQKSKYMTL
jgi:hypothetical protein